MLTYCCTLRLPCSVLVQSAFARYGFETASAAHVRFSAPIDSGAFVPSGSQDEITACRICSVVCLPKPAGIRRAGCRGAARKSGVQGKSVSVRVDLGGTRFIKKKNNPY